MTEEDDARFDTGEIGSGGISITRIDNHGSDTGNGNPASSERGWSADGDAFSIQLADYYKDHDVDRNEDHDVDHNEDHHDDHDDDDDVDVDVDDDEDNWSRQVETDDTLHRMASMGTVEETHDDDGRSDGVVAVGPASVGSSDAAVHDRDHDLLDRSPSRAPSSALIPQPRPQPTMKEKLVERERQRRVESERARWKRQFAMAAHAELDQDEENDGGGGGGGGGGEMDGDSLRGDHSFALGRGGDDGHDYETNGDFDRSYGIGPNSVAGTVGEDTVAPIETLDDETSTNMNYPMERFLKEQQHADRDGEGRDALLGKPPGSNEATHPVVMELFLQEPQAEAAAGGYEGGGSPASLAVVPPGESLLGDGPLTASDAPDSPSADHHHHHHHHQLALPSPSREEIRVVLRLTEAEIQEMAAIDDASRSNAPPSERDDISELGELVSDFGMVVHTDHQNLSQGTPVTALESVTSSLQPNTVGSVVSSDRCRSMEDVDVDVHVDGHSISSNIVLASSAGGDVSLTGNPPSDILRDDDDDDEDGNDNDDDDDEDHHHESVDGPVVVLSPRVPTEILPTTAVDVSIRSFPESPNADASVNDPGSDLPMIPTDEAIVNRTMRPGMFRYDPTPVVMDLDSPPDTQLSTPQKKHAGGVGPSGGLTDPPPIDHQHQHIEGFDFDKDHYSPSLVRDGQGEVVLVRNEMWSPGLSPEREGRVLSIDGDAAAAAPTPTATAMPEYGAVSRKEDDLQPRLARRTDPKTPESETAEPTAPDGRVESGSVETQPLLDRGIRSTPAAKSETLAWDRGALGSMLRNADERRALIESVFCAIRSGDLSARDASDAVANAAVSDALLQQRASPERLRALAATLLLELPLLLWVVGGDRLDLCGILGRSRHTALVALLPIVCALSGAVGLQASASTTRAIVGGGVTPENYASWVVRETEAALYLGLGTGAVTGLVALLASGFGFGFAVSVGVAQCLGATIAGGTGSLAPFVSTVLRPNDSGVWSGPLITSVQDLLSSLVVVIATHRILAMLGPYDIAPNDVCIPVYDAEV